MQVTVCDPDASSSDQREAHLVDIKYKTPESQEQVSYDLVVVVRQNRACDWEVKLRNEQVCRAAIRCSRDHTVLITRNAHGSQIISEVV